MLRCTCSRFLDSVTETGPAFNLFRINCVQDVRGVSLHGIEIARVLSGQGSVLCRDLGFSYGGWQQTLAFRGFSPTVHDVANVIVGSVLLGEQAASGKYRGESQGGPETRII